MQCSDRDDKRWVSVKFKGELARGYIAERLWAGASVGEIVTFCTGQGTPFPPATGATLNGRRVGPRSSQVLKQGDELIISIPSAPESSVPIGAAI
jgi:hypothetical protein